MSSNPPVSAARRCRAAVEYLLFWAVLVIGWPLTTWRFALLTLTVIALWAAGWMEGRSNV